MFTLPIIIILTIMGMIIGIISLMEIYKNNFLKKWFSIITIISLIIGILILITTLYIYTIPITIHFD